MRIAIASLLFGLVTLSAASAADELQIYSVMYRDPTLSLPANVLTFDPRLKVLWETALRRPEEELQRLAADTIAMAHQRGMPDLMSTSDELVKLVKLPETPVSVRRAAAHALVALDAKKHAGVLADVAKQHGLELQIVIEPALAKWGIDNLHDTWHKRLTDKQTPALLQLLAIEGLGHLRAKSAKPALLELVRNSQVPANRRLAAAKSLATIGDGGLLEDARRLLADKSSSAVVQRVLGVYLLSAHRDPEAFTQLAELASDSEPAVAAAALGRLFEVDPKLVFPLAAQALKNADVNVRRVGAQALIVRSDVEAMETVAPLFDDPNPLLRRFVTKSLFELSKKPELRPTILALAEKTLTQEGWRGLEQATLLLGYMEHKPAAKRFLELLNHPRREVAVTTGWALGRLKVPETYPELLTHSNAQYAKFIDTASAAHNRYTVALQLTQLFQLFGEVRFRDADPLMRKYIPKAVDIGETRTAACWGLGKIHEGEAVEDLVELFEQRLTDINSMPPELEPIRTMCAIGLGRMKAHSTLQTLEQFSLEGSHVGLACYWSIQQLTGKKPPEITEIKSNVLGWFLQPLDP